MLRDENVCMWHQDGPLKNRVKEWKAMDGFVVVVNGCFDLLHAGHLAVLRYAKTRTWLDPEKMMLVVALNSDHSVRQLKGEGRPIVAFKQRAEAVRQVKGVDWVTGFEESTPLQLIETIRPDLLIKGGGYYDDEDIVGEDFVIKNGGCVLFAPMLDGMSTTEIVKKIRT